MQPAFTIDADAAPSGARIVHSAIVARVMGDTSFDRGTRLALSFPADQLHFFDLDSGTSLLSNAATGTAGGAGLSGSATASPTL